MLCETINVHNDVLEPQIDFVKFNDRYGNNKTNLNL